MLPPKTPMHPFANFLKACEIRGAVMVTRSALSTVEQLGLSPASDAVLAWITGGGVENPEHWNTEPWQNNPDPEWKRNPCLESVVWVDAFTFRSGLDEGYIAYLFQPRTGLWLLKSLKRN